MERRTSLGENLATSAGRKAPYLSHVERRTSLRRKSCNLGRQESNKPQPCGEKDQFAGEISQPPAAAPHENHGTSTSTREEPVCGGHVRGHSMSGRPPSDCRPGHVGRPGRCGALAASTSMSMLAAIPWAYPRSGMGFMSLLNSVEAFGVGR